MLWRTFLTTLWLVTFAVLDLAAQSALAQSLTPQAIAQLQALIVDKQNRSPAELKIDSNLLFGARAMIQAKLGTQGALPSYTENFIAEEVRADGTVMVNIRATVSDALIGTLKDVGASDIKSFPQYDTITARVPIIEVHEIAARPDVRFIAPLEKPLTNAAYIANADGNKGDSPPVSNVGSVTSQGVAAHAADLAIASGISGAGGTVCVLSTGIDSFVARQATGDLPTPLYVLPGQSGSGDEGTAMLEIVHDLAPGSDLGFATGNGGEGQMATNILNLRSAGCAIIVDDVSYFTEAAFQDGPIAQAVNSVVGSGALFFSSAGNSGNVTHGTSGTWEGDWVDSGFTYSGFPVHRFGTNPYDALTSGNGSAISLNWSDQRGGSANDYDLFLFDATLSTILHQSTNSQTGFQDPLEWFTCSGGTCPVGSLVVVVKFAGSPRALRVDTHRGQLSVNTTESTYGHNAASTAVTVAAVDVATAGGGRFVGGGANPVEFFSSDGPRKIFYNPNGTAITPGNFLFATGGGATLAKVDLAAADRVSTSTPGFSPFAGTSAAAPHAAALAALVWSANPSNSAATVKSALLGSALDIEAAGFDRDSGVGIAMAPAAVRAVMTPLGVGVSFSPSLIATGGMSTLTITLTNPNQVTLQNVTFTDTYPAQIKNAAVPNPGGTGVGCGGTLSATPNGGSFAMTAGTVPAGGTCNIFVTVTSSIAGSFLNSTGAIATPVGLNSSAATASLTVGIPPGITSANHTTFTVAFAGSFQVSTSGFPIPSLGLTGTLPQFVTFNTGTGLLSGTPIAGTGGTYPLSINAANGLPPDAFQSFTLTVNEPPTITSQNGTTFSVGSFGSFAFTTIGFPVPGIAVSGTLPNGVAYNPATRTISGTPLAGSGGVYSLTLTANNGVGIATQSFTLTVNASPAITSGNNTTFTVGAAGTFTVTATGYPPPTFTRSGALPTGVNFDTATGVLSGAPAAGTGGVYPLTIGAVNGVLPNASQPFTLTVSNGVARSWVASFGADGNPCTVALPCRTFGRAISTTITDGEVVVLDAAGYGGVVIDKPVTIVAPAGVYAGISVTSGHGIDVNPGSGRVVLRGLSLTGLGGDIGVNMISGDALYIENCVIGGFTNAGVSAFLSAQSTLFIRDSTIRDNGIGALLGTTTGASGPLRAVVERSHFENNGTGIGFTGATVLGTISDTMVIGGTLGLNVNPTAPGAPTKITARKSTFTKATTSGVRVGGVAGTTATASLVQSQVTGSGIGIETLTGGTAYVSATAIVRNATGVTTGSGTAISLGDNQLTSNGTDGTFSTTVPKQ